MNNPRTQRSSTGGTTAFPGSSRPAADTFVEGEALFLASLPVIDDITGQVRRRFERRSSLPTYVTVVIQRLFLDYRNRLWGKWRPSSDAKRLGPTAMLLERLVA